MAERFEHAQFLENLNSSFRLPLEGGESLDLRLIGISELNKTARQEFFSIIFCCGLDQVLPQRIYGLEHDKLGRLDLFLVPIKKDEQGVHYEAVFNRMLDHSGGSGTAS
jgi:hypothetical protein